MKIFACFIGIALISSTLADSSFSSDWSYKAFDRINALRNQFGLPRCSWNNDIFGVVMKNCNERASGREVDVKLETLPATTMKATSFARTNWQDPQVRLLSSLFSRVFRLQFRI
jgi:hypothetical protein